MATVAAAGRGYPGRRVGRGTGPARQQLDPGSAAAPGPGPSGLRLAIMHGIIQVLQVTAARNSVTFR